MKQAFSLLTFAATLALSGSAFAQMQGQWGGSYQPAVPQRSSGIDNIGEEMQFVFGVDGVMGVDFIRDKQELSVGGQTAESTTKTTSVALFGGGAAGLPRLALDYFVAEGISVGGSFVYWSQSGETETSAGGTSQTADNPTLSTIFVHPRVGYAMPFDETFSIWPRAGIAYLSQKTSPDQGPDISSTAFDLTVEAMVGISPFTGFAILVGPYLNLGLSGSKDVASPTGTGTEEADRTLTLYGLTTSIVGYY